MSMCLMLLEVHGKPLLYLGPCEKKVGALKWVILALISMNMAGKSKDFFSLRRTYQARASLDAFEGEAYRRVVVKVKLKDGCKIDAYIYTLRSP